MTLVADSFAPLVAPGSSRGALPISLLLHGLLLAAALWLFNRSAPNDTPDLESISVSIIATEHATDLTPTPDRSDAAQTLVAAGATTPVGATPATVAEPAIAEPIDSDIPPSRPELTESVQTSVAMLPPVDAVQPVKAAHLSAGTAAAPSSAAAEPAEDATSRAAAAVVDRMTVVAAETAAPAETAEAEDADPTTAAVVATPSVSPEGPNPLSSKAVHPVIEERPAPPSAGPAEKPGAKPNTSIKAKKPAKSKLPAGPKPAPPGSGGKSEANAKASAAAPGGSGRVAAGGSAEESRYPGLVQAALRRALRYPPNAGVARGTAVVRFFVAADGSVSSISLVSRTGSSVLDAAAVDTVRRAAPFPPIPASAGRSSWSFTLPLQFRR